MMRWLLGTAAVVTLVVLAVLTLPARLLPRLIDDQALRLAGVSGTLLEGSAARALLSTPAGPLHLGRLSWELHPASLLTLSPRIGLSSRWGAQQLTAQVRIDGRRLELTDVDANVDAQLLRTLMPVAAGGRISLQFERLLLDNGLPLDAEGRVVWQDARWQAAQVEYALGSYVAVVDRAAGPAPATPENAALRARIETLAGPVGAEGEATLAGRRFALDVAIRGAGRPLEAQLEQALRLIATPEEDGYRLRLDGAFTPPP